MNFNIHDEKVKIFTSIKEKVHELKKNYTQWKIAKIIWENEWDFSTLLKGEKDVRLETLHRIHKKLQNL